MKEMVKVIIALIVLALASQGCGMKAGGLVVGTTGFLAESNRGRVTLAQAAPMGAPMDSYTPAEKKVLEETINLHTWRK